MGCSISKRLRIVFGIIVSGGNVFGVTQETDAAWRLALGEGSRNCLALVGGLKLCIFVALEEGQSR